MNTDRKLVLATFLFLIVLSVASLLFIPRYIPNANCSTPDGQVAHCGIMDVWTTILGSDLLVGAILLGLWLLNPSSMKVEKGKELE